MGEMDIEKGNYSSVNNNHDDDKLCCGGLGTGWVLFIIGFFLGCLPWYIGLIILLFTKNEKEKPGYMACAIAAAITSILVVISAITEITFK